MDKLFHPTLCNGCDYLSTCSSRFGSKTDDQRHGVKQSAISDLRLSPMPQLLLPAPLSQTTPLSAPRRLTFLCHPVLYIQRTTRVFLRFKDLLPQSKYLAKMTLSPQAASQVLLLWWTSISISHQASWQICFLRLSDPFPNTQILAQHHHVWSQGSHRVQLHPSLQNQDFLNKSAAFPMTRDFATGSHRCDPGNGPGNWTTAANSKCRSA